MPKQTGPRYNEFEVLYQNMKYGLTATKELVDFLKERSSLEESYSKSLVKLAKIAANANCNGTFAPYWQLLKTSSEKLSNIHLQMTQKVQELVKDLAKYAEELQKKHKSVKEEEAGTLEAVQQIQNSTAMAMKTKEVYQQRQAELDKYQKDNASAKDIEKAEGKTKKAQEEYKQWVEKYQTCREEYQTKMPLACKHFQDVETSHLQQMKEFVNTYAEIMDTNHVLIEQVNSEFREECNRMTIDKLMELLKSKTADSDTPMLIDVLVTTEDGLGNGDSLIPGLGGASSASGVTGGSLLDDKSLNGGGSDKYSTTTSGSSLAAVVEKKKEGNVNVDSSGSVSVVEGEIRTTSKGSRRTTSLLNLFIPLSSQGNKSNISSSVSSSSNNNNNNNAAAPGSNNRQGSSSASATVSDSPNFDHQVLASTNDAKQPTLTRSSNSRGSKCHESSGFLALSPLVRTTSAHRRSTATTSSNNVKIHNHSESSSSTTTTTTTSTADTLLSTKVLGFLRSRRGKKNKDKKRGKKKDGNSSGKEDKSDGEDKDESQKSETPTAEIDEEGYSVPPKSTWENDKSSFYSSSDTDSDDEREKRLHIEIKPLSNGTAPLSASVDELRSTVENLTLSPAGMTGAFCNTLKSRKLLHEADSQMKRSQSVSQQIGSSSPPSRHPYTPLSPPIPPPNPRSSPKLPIGVVVGGPNDSVTSTVSSRYADLGDLFAEIGDIQPTAGGGIGGGIASNISTLSKSSLSSASQVRNTPTPTSTTIPRPSSRPRPEGLGQRNSTNSPSPAISRTESIGSLERSIGSHIIGSRGPSPLTIGMADTIPLAVAFHEIVHASFKGNDESLCQVKMTGDMMVSFPAGIIQVFANNPSPSQLSFHVKSSQPLDNLVSNKELVNVEKVSGGLTFEFNMSALVALLKNHSEQNPTASYFNIDILKYHISPKSGAASCPLHLVAFWKCDTSQTDLRIDYKYNSHAMVTPLTEGPPGGATASTTFNSTPTNAASSNATYPPLLQVCVAAPVDGGVKSMQSKPNGQWFPNTNRACWKIPALSYSFDNQGIGSLRARFEINNGPSSAGAIAAQFSCENSTLSGCEFQLSGTGYRVSLIKKRFVSGKYTCEAVDSASRYAIPPGPGSDSGIQI